MSPVNISAEKKLVQGQPKSNERKTDDTKVEAAAIKFELFILKKAEQNKSLLSHSFPPNHKMIFKKKDCIKVKNKITPIVTVICFCSKEVNIRIKCIIHN